MPCGEAGRIPVKLPLKVILPGRLMEVRLHFGELELVCEIPDASINEGVNIGCDLGVNTLICATDGKQAIAVSGRAVKSAIQWRNKKLATIQQAQSSKTKGSRRWKRLQRRKYKVLGKTRRKVNDLLHKASTKVAQTFPHAKAYVGEPFNDAAQKTHRTVSQQISQTCTRKLINLLNYKLAGAITVPEHWSSQTCPVCGHRNKHRRIYRCSHCRTLAPRDVIGCLNILNIGIYGEIQTGCHVPNVIKFVHPSKYPVKKQVDPQDTGQVALTSQLKKPPSL